MEKLWAGRAGEKLDTVADEFNSSIRIDSRMYAEDIAGSIAHASMLSSCGIIPEGDAAAIIAGLESIRSDIETGALSIDPNAEDIHSFVEGILTARIGDAGKMLHTARSRNDQVAVDVRLYLRSEAEKTVALINELITAVADKAEENADTVLPGYTHLQRAQPITFGHQLCAYGMMLSRDAGRLTDAKKRLNISPLGCGALAGTTYPIDRAQTAAALGFDGYTLNSLDGVSDRDFCVELASALSILMMHLSRLCEEIILWSSWEFGFVELSDAYTTGSSIMPQKKNSDMAELIRGKSGRVYGDLMGLLTMLKGLPLAYNKDMQEDKEFIFDAFDTAKMCLRVMSPMLASMKVKADNMLAAAKGGYINATDLADYLTKKGVPFRTSYHLTGQIVAYCINKGVTLDELTPQEYSSFSPLFDAGLYDAIDLSVCVSQRTSAGGTGAESVKAQIEFLRSAVK